MPKNNEKRVKSLKKGYIWPAVLMLVIAVLMVFLSFVLFMTITISYFINDRFDTEYESCKLAVSLVNSKGAQTALNQIEELALSDAVFVLDENGAAVCSYGEKSWNEADELKLDFDCVKEGYRLFSDKKSPVPVAANENGAIDTSYVISDFIARSDFIDNEITGGSKKTVCEMTLWFSKKLEGGGTLMMKGRLPLYFGDFLLAVTITGLAGIMLLVPVVLMFINILVGVVNQRRMVKLMYTDMVTGGKNWFYFGHEASRLLRSDKPYAVVDITLMKYRNFCACHGVQAGETLLAGIEAYITLHYINKKELCARHSKSSFALLLRFSDRDELEKRVNVMLNELDDAFENGIMAFHAGICFTGEADRKARVTPAEYFSRASAARETIFEENVNAAAVFDQKLLEANLWEHKVEERMQSALDNKEFHVYIQPKFDPATEKLVGAEALVRWINDTDGFIPPGKFIPIFEKNGFITKLDDYMISNVSRLQAGWIAEGRNVVPISVNVSRAHFADPELAKHICELVDEYRVPHGLIEIELTESAFFDDREALFNTVRELEIMGFETSMDDFGAGYSSLNSLKDLPLNVLKLDAEFFRGEGQKNRGEIVVAEAIQLAKKLNMRTVAEGVEKKDQVDFLAGQGCDMIQGFYYAKPMPADEYEKRI